jgi:DNA-binding NtrC family response regulator
MGFLLVDADRNFREALAIALRLEGHTVAAAATAEEGLERIAQGGVRCCVVDAVLTHSDSVLAAAVAAGVRAVVTATYPDLLASAARRNPRAEMLLKPFAPVVLLGLSAA